MVCVFGGAIGAIRGAHLRAAVAQFEGIEEHHSV